MYPNRLGAILAPKGSARPGPKATPASRLSLHIATSAIAAGKVVASSATRAANHELQEILWRRRRASAVLLLFGFLNRTRTSLGRIVWLDVVRDVPR